MRFRPSARSSDPDTMTNAVLKLSLRRTTKKTNRCRHSAWAWRSYLKPRPSYYSMTFVCSISQVMVFVLWDTFVAQSIVDEAINLGDPKLHRCRYISSTLKLQRWYFDAITCLDYSLPEVARDIIFGLAIEEDRRDNSTFFYIF